MTGRRATSLTGAGLFAGAAAWALHQQVGYILATWACDDAAAGVWISAAITMFVLLAGAILSFAAIGQFRYAGAPQPRGFLALVSLMAAALFLFALALQTAAALFLPGCIG